MPVLFQTDDHALLIFDSASSGTRRAIEFRGCLAAQFGYPNDEAIAGDPLHRQGLRPYGVFEVVDSSWLERLSRMNRMTFPDSLLTGYRHFAITLHDSTSECLALGAEPRDLDDSTVAEIVQQLHGESA